MICSSRKLPTSGGLPRGAGAPAFPSGRAVAPVAEESAARPVPRGHVDIDVATNHVSVRDLATSFGSVERLEGTLPLDRLLALQEPSLPSAQRVLENSPVQIDVLELRLTEAALTKNLQRLHLDDPQPPVMRLTGSRTFEVDGAKKVFGQVVPYHVEGTEMVSPEGHLRIRIDGASAFGVLPIYPFVNENIAKELASGRMFFGHGRKVRQGAELALQDCLPPFVPLRLRQVENGNGEMILVASSPPPSAAHIASHPVVEDEPPRAVPASGASPAAPTGAHASSQSLEDAWGQCSDPATYHDWEEWG